MARIYKLSDRIKYKVGEIEIEISPLSFEDKNILQQMGIKISKGDYSQILESTKHAIKSSVKSVKGLYDENGAEYKVQFDSSGKKLTDECSEELLNMEYSSSLGALCASLLSGIPKDKLPEGVSLVEDKKESPN